MEIAKRCHRQGRLLERFDQFLGSGCSFEPKDFEIEKPLTMLAVLDWSHAVDHPMLMQRSAAMQRV